MSSIEKAIARLEPDYEHKSSRVPLVQAAIDQKPADKNTEYAISKESPARLEFDWNSLATNGYLTPQLTQSRLAEEYRILKRTILANAKNSRSNFDTRRNLVAITSTLMGEGKTFTTFNLAVSIATGWDNTVLIVDADLENQSLTELVGLTEAPGLTDILLDPVVELRDVIVHTSIPELRIIPAGQRYPDGSELMACGQMRELAYELSDMYSDRIVLFDTPPLLESTQSLALSSLAGQVLVVIEEGKTPRKSIKEAVEFFDEEKIIGLVLNKCGRWSGNRYLSHRNGPSI